MALCDTCLHYMQKFDELRQNFDDVIVEKAKDKRQKHFCPMYDDNIPNEIYYENADCMFYTKQNRLK